MPEVDIFVTRHSLYTLFNVRERPGSSATITGTRRVAASLTDHLHTSFKERERFQASRQRRSHSRRDF